MHTSELSRLFLLYTGTEAESVKKIPAEGSNRQYYRLQRGDVKLIGVYGPSKEENRAFVYLSDFFREKELPIPEVYSISECELYYLQEDLGDHSLYDRIRPGASDQLNLMKEVVRLLPAFQYKGREVDFSRCYPVPSFDRRSVLWDLNYFKYCFLKPSGIEFREDLLEDDFEKLAGILLSEDNSMFMYRDFQSRNILIRDNTPWFIDFQGGRRGPVYYDIASFLWQVRADFPEEIRDELLDIYLKELNKYTPVEEEHFYTMLPYFVLFRMLQVLGAYGFRGNFERKSQFKTIIPGALEKLNGLLTEHFEDLPSLKEILLSLVRHEQGKYTPDSGKFTVEIISFSYKKGIPENCTDHGGGFVFDCRALHNPGRYEEYKQLTGRDRQVITFLEEDGEILKYLEEVYALVDFSVTRYLERDFKYLSVAFGCTGGQHRSVFAAQHLAEHLFKSFGVSVRLLHRELNIEEKFETE